MKLLSGVVCLDLGDDPDNDPDSGYGYDHYFRRRFAVSDWLSIVRWPFYGENSSFKQNTMYFVMTSDNSDVGLCATQYSTSNSYWKWAH